MKDLNTYRTTLKKVSSKIEQFDFDVLDYNYMELKKAFDFAYNFEIFNLTNINKEKVDAYKYELFKILTLSSGNLSFLAIQILAANSIMTNNDFVKKEEYLNKKCGIAINHLRVPKTIISALKVKNGYMLNGTLTWASGYKIFDTLLIGFHCENLEFEVMADFKEQKGFKIGVPSKTFVGNSLNTVNIELDNFFVKEENIVSNNPIGNYTRNKSISKTVHLCLYALGNSALFYIEDIELKNNAQLKLDSLKDKFLFSSNLQNMDKLRVHLFELVQSIITTGMILNGGKSILSTQNLQRLYREIIMFNSNGLNNDLKNISKQNFLNQNKEDK